MMAPSEDQRPAGQELNFRAVQAEERKLIERKRQIRGVSRNKPQPPQKRAGADQGGEAVSQERESEQTQEQRHANDYLGLAFSGGGIRSATFNLGILQALAKMGLLKHVDYLSTVSGGGYLGGWFSALLRRYGSLQRVCDEVLSKGAAEKDSALEPYPIRYLRRFSNYLTPKLGVLGLDVWTALATYLRNLLLNWMILIPGIVAALLVPYLLVGLAEWVLYDPQEIFGHTTLIAVIAFLGLLLLCAAACAGREMAQLSNSKLYKDHEARQLAPEPKPASSSNDAPAKTTEGGTEEDSAPSDVDKLLGSSSFKVIFGFLLIPLLGLVLISALLLRRSAAVWPAWEAMLTGSVASANVLWFAVVVIALYSVFWLVARFVWCARMRFFCQATWESEQTDQALLKRVGAGLLPRSFKRILVAVTSVVLSSFIMGLLLFYLLRWFMDLSSPVLGLVLGPPALLLWLFMLATLHKGLARGLLHEQHREWFGRVSGFLLAVALVWLVVFAFAVFFPLAVYAAAGLVSTSALLAWLGATLATLSSGRSQEANQPTSAVRGLVLSLGPYIFVIGLIGVLSLAAQKLASGLGHLSASPETMERIGELHRLLRISFQYPDWAWQMFWSDAWPKYIDLVECISVSGGAISLILILGAIVTIFSWLVDVNDFSLQNFYANRLARAYLGASQDVKKRQSGEIVFTGFNHGDDIPLSEIEHGGEQNLAHDGPYHLICAALNLAATNELSWQERKAGSYVFSPLYCGYTLSAPKNEAAGKTDFISAYCSTQSMRTHAIGEPLSLGTAVATSGAAASPNMGFRTTAALAFLLTFFNVRLGRWIGNPLHRKQYNLVSPRVAHLSLLRELFANTTSNSHYIYVSDGGHFENLGVYELLRRQCRFIIACDAGQDANYEYADLGNLIRKARADLGVDIDIDTRAICLQEDGLSGAHCATGLIKYPKGEVGYLIYIKPSLTGDEPVDILNYKKVNPDFPHQSTADQFFSESQFESYRKLGRTIGHQVFERAVEDATRSGKDNETGWVSNGHVLTGQEGRLPFSMDQLFSMLRAHWYPENPANHEHFTRHSQTYRSLMQELRRDERLHFLLPQFYPEWSQLSDVPLGTSLDQEEAEGLTDGTAFDFSAMSFTEWDKKRVTYVPTDDRNSFNAAFTFCSSLIQLMEDVYLDLQLDHYFDHPDNRGWMNLFKHWAWSGMMRVSWAIAASTYGQRFQLFCYRHLGMGVGDVMPELLVKTEGDESVKASLIDDNRMFNFYEKEQLKKILDELKACGKHRDIRIYQLQLVVKEFQGSDAELIRFCYGYVVMAGANIVGFRVQDHLRKMSLARRGLRKLIQQDFKTEEQIDLLRYAWHEDKKLYERLYTTLQNDFDYNKRCLNRFYSLFNSVRREVRTQPGKKESKT